MSVRLANTTRTKDRTARRASVPVFVVLCGIVCGLSVALGGGRAGAQPTKLEDIEKNAKKVDQNNPVPVDAPGRQPPEKLAVDGKRLMFTAIEDFKPVASERRTGWNTWRGAKSWPTAKQFATTDLELYAARDLTPLDLIKTRGLVDSNEPQKPRPSAYRCSSCGSTAS